MQHEGRRIGGFGRGDTFIERLLRVQRFGVENAVEREFRRSRIEGGAVMEADALAQMEAIGQQIGRDLPAGRQARLHRAARA